ncbi:hypothetical protein [Novosphingobium sp.]|uniref:hypothetical protein n=1 Tax=Novosphingobium sp. TaxID=1874826 RepID=UPI00286C1CDF|nr:hypothetical protein [Novosphingobium sp.]
MMRKILLPLACLVAASPASAQSDPAPAPAASPTPVPAPTPAPAPAPAPKPPKAIAKELASGDGKSQETAYVIYENSEGTGVAKEYVILRFLGLKPQGQALIFDEKSGKPYDVLTVLDPATGKESEVWFDISNYFGKF